MAELDPLVSVVVPTYNSAAHLGQCVESVLDQTYGNLELICVDDGSGDGTLDLLRSYEASDPRVRVIAQENAGPGAARNRGVEAARGVYISFLDSDDWAEPQLVEHAVRRLEETGAQIATFPYYDYDERVGIPYATEGIVLEDAYEGDAFSWRDNPDWIFRALQNLMWNKVFRADFIRENHIRCQEDVRLTEDLMFTAPALVLADDLTFVHERLVYHRAGTGGNTMAHKDDHPLDFYTAFLTLRRWIEGRGLWSELRVAYVNWAVDGCIYNLQTLNTPEGFRLVYDTLAREGLGRLGLLDVAPSVYHEDRFREFIAHAQTEDAEHGLYRYYRNERGDSRLWWYRNAVANVFLQEEQERRGRLERRCEDLEARNEELEKRVRKLTGERDDALADAEALRESSSYRLGNAVARPAAKLRDALHRRD